MTAIREVRYPTWWEFKRDMVRDLFGGETFVKNRYLFRGQASADWSLTSSFDRRFERLPVERRADVAQSMLACFREECARTGDRGTAWSNHDAAQIAQHYGMPTRLLDWSTSPYVAAFFAFADVVKLGTKGKVAVWVIGRESVWLRAQDVAVIPANHGIDVRMRNQNGWFTFMREGHTSLDGLARAAGTGDTSLIRMLIPCEECVGALADLDAMGINHAALFPGFEGFAKTAELRALLASRD